MLTEREVGVGVGGELPALQIQVTVGHYREKQRRFLILHETEQFYGDGILQDKD